MVEIVGERLETALGDYSRESFECLRVRQDSAKAVICGYLRRVCTPRYEDDVCNLVVGWAWR